MPQIRFTRNIQRHVPCPDADCPGSTIGEVLDAYFTLNPKARNYVLDDQGELRKHMAIFLNSTQIADRSKLSDKVAEKDVIDVIQALSGG